MVRGSANGTRKSTVGTEKRAYVGASMPHATDPQHWRTRARGAIAHMPRFRVFQNHPLRHARRPRLARAHLTPESPRRQRSSGRVAAHRRRPTLDAIIAARTRAGAARAAGVLRAVSSTRRGRRSTRCEPSDAWEREEVMDALVARSGRRYRGAAPRQPPWRGASRARVGAGAHDAMPRPARRPDPTFATAAESLGDGCARSASAARTAETLASQLRCAGAVAAVSSRGAAAGAGWLPVVAASLQKVGRRRLPDDVRDPGGARSRGGATNDEQRAAPRTRAGRARDVRHCGVHHDRRPCRYRAGRAACPRW